MPIYQVTRDLELALIDLNEFDEYQCTLELPKATVGLKARKLKNFKELFDIILAEGSTVTEFNSIAIEQITSHLETTYF